ncbi:MAG: glucokinase [Myxococcales bacterium]|nr:glucokinase [Myxococcales bacterium]
MRILAGDIGGTKSELALYEGAPEDGFRELRRARFASADFGGLLPLLQSFRGDDAAIDAAGFAVAGPVGDGRATLTNLSWQALDERELGAALGAPVALRNDFAANVEGLSELNASELRVLNRGQPRADGAIALVGAGTGLGQALALPRPDAGLQVLAAEGGHADFAPQDRLGCALLEFLQARHGAHISVERVVSGPGLLAVYDFFCETGRAPSDPALRARIAAGDGPRQVAEHGVLEPAPGVASDPACAAALEFFLRAYGAEAGNVALRCLPTAGLYIAGGIAPKLLHGRQADLFCQALFAKGRMEPLLRTLPIAVVLQPRLGLLGARKVAASLRP